MSYSVKMLNKVNFLLFAVRSKKIGTWQKAMNPETDLNAN